MKLQQRIVRGGLIPRNNINPGGYDAIVFVRIVFLILFILFPLLSSSQSKGDAWLDLMTGHIYGANEKVKPSGPIVWGSMIKEMFQPSNIVDYGYVAKEPDPKFTPGWIELRTGAIRPDYEGRAPEEPFLRGRIDPKGLFHDRLMSLATAELVRGVNNNSHGTITTSHLYTLDRARRKFMIDNDPGEMDLIRLEGRIFATGLLQPQGTVPLYSWHQVQRRHYPSSEPRNIPTEMHPRSLVTTSPSLAAMRETLTFFGRFDSLDYWVRPNIDGWEFIGLEGYIFDQPCPGTLPLYGWYNLSTDPDRRLRASSSKIKSLEHSG